MQQQLQPCMAVAATPGWTLTLGLTLGPGALTITLTIPHSSVIKILEILY